MENFNLSNEEIIYLASYLGAEDIYGIPDNLSELSDVQLKMKIIDIENGLNEKEYLRMGFDEQIKIQPKIEEIMDVCVNTESIIAITNRTKEKGIYSAIYYALKGKFVKIIVGNEGNVVSLVDYNSLKDEISSLTKGEFQEDGNNQQFSVPETDFEKISNLARKGRGKTAIDKLVQLGVNEEVSSTVVEGLNIIKGKTEFYSVLFASKDIADSESMGESIVFLKDEKCVLLGEAVDEDNRTNITLEVVSRERIEELLQAGFKKVKGFAPEGEAEQINFS